MQDILRTYRQAPMDVYPKLRQNLNLPIARIFLEALEIEGASPKQFHLALASAMQAELPHLGAGSAPFLPPSSAYLHCWVYSAPSSA